MKILERYTPDIEIYSIDEAFLQFKGFEHFDLDAQGRARKSKYSNGRYSCFSRYCAY